MNFARSDRLLEAHLRGLSRAVKRPKPALPTAKTWGKDNCTPMGIVKSQATKSSMRAKITLPPVPWDE